MDVTDKLKTPARCSGMEQLQHATNFQDRSLHGFSLSMIVRGHDDGFKALLTKHLGTQTCTVEHGNEVWSRWENEDYILYATDDLFDFDRTTKGLEYTVAAIHWDLGMGDQKIPRSEWKALHAEGKTLGLAHLYDVPCQTPDKLKQFVLNYCDGQIFCDHQVRDQALVGMVFMPLGLGALSIEAPEKDDEPSPEWLALQTLRRLGPEPVRGNPPPSPIKPPYPKPPTPPLFVEPDQEKTLVMQEDIAWEVAAPERLENYLEAIRLQNVALEASHADALSVWEEAKAVIDAAHEASLLAHAESVATWEMSTQQFEVHHDQWEKEKTREEARIAGFYEGRCSEIAVLYEYVNQAGPRGINGYPIFFSFSILNRMDWERAHRAIVRELERRENMEI